MTYVVKFFSLNAGSRLSLRLSEHLEKLLLYLFILYFVFCATPENGIFIVVIILLITGTY